MDNIIQQINSLNHTNIHIFNIVYAESLNDEIGREYIYKNNSDISINIWKKILIKSFIYLKEKNVEPIQSIIQKFISTFQSYFDKIHNIETYLDDSESSLSFIYKEKKLDGKKIIEEICEIMMSLHDFDLVYDNTKFFISLYDIYITYKCIDYSTIKYIK